MTVTIKKRDRSPNFPFITLEQAIGRANEFYKHEKRGSAPVLVAVAHWEYQPLSSGGKQTIAALKSYGLLEDDGRGEARKVKLTDLALRILFDTREDPTERTRCIQSAALNPTVFRNIYDHWPSDAPSAASLNHYLIFDLQFSPDGAKDAAKIFLKNAELALLYGPFSIPYSGDSKGDSMIVGVPEPSVQYGPKVSPNQVTAPLIGSSKLERIIGPTGEIVVQFAGDASLEAYQFLEEYIKLRKTVLKQSAKESKEG